MSKKNVNVSINVEDETLSKILEFNIKNKLGYIDLNHLPFNQFSLNIKDRLGKYTNEDLMESLDRVVDTMGISEDQKNLILKNYVLDYVKKAKDGDTDFSSMTLYVKCKNNIIDINIGSVAKVSLKTKSSKLDLTEKPSKTLEDISMSMTSDRLALILSNSEECTKKFNNFCLDNVTYVLHTLIYM